VTRRQSPREWIQEAAARWIESGALAAHLAAATARVRRAGGRLSDDDRERLAGIERTVRSYRELGPAIEAAEELLRAAAHTPNGETE